MTFSAEFPLRFSRFAGGALGTLTGLAAERAPVFFASFKTHNGKSLALLGVGAVVTQDLFYD